MKLSVIGAGAMGGATVEGLLKTDIFSAQDITVADPYEPVLHRFNQLGTLTTTCNADAVADKDIVMVVVKPWLVESVLEGIKDKMDYSRQILVVVAAGVSSDDILQWLDKGDGHTPKLALAIPNTAIAQCQSMTFLVPVSLSAEEKDTVCGIFNSVGKAMIVEERMLAAGTTLASCGIAYAMRYVRAASEGGVEIGFKADDAKDIVLQTIKGAVELLQANGNHPEAEIDKVTTPGGVTIRGLNEMEHAGFTSAVIRGLKAGMKK